MMGPAAEDGSLLVRRNPTIKLALVLVVSLVVLFVLDPITPAVLYLLGLVGLLAATRISARTLVLAHIPFLAFALGIFVVNVLSRPGQVLWQAGPLRVTAEGLSVGGALALRTLLIGVLAIAFITSTDGVALMHSLRRSIRLNPRVAYALLAGYRMLQDMLREWSTIQHAHAVRAPLPRAGRRSRLPRGPRHLARVIFTLLVVTVRRGERIAQALESRGLGLSPRTTWRPVLITGGDWALAAVVLAVLAGVLVASAITGVLRGPGMLSG